MMLSAKTYNGFGDFEPANLMQKMLYGREGHLSKMSKTKMEILEPESHESPAYAAAKYCTKNSLDSLEKSGYTKTLDKMPHTAVTST